MERWRNDVAIQSGDHVDCRAVARKDGGGDRLRLCEHHDLGE